MEIRKSGLITEISVQKFYVWFFPTDMSLGTDIVLSFLYWGISWKKPNVSFFYRNFSNQSRFPYLQSEKKDLIGLKKIICLKGFFSFKQKIYLN